MNKQRLLQIAFQNEVTKDDMILKRWVLRFVDPDFEDAYLQTLWGRNKITTLFGVVILIILFLVGFASDVYLPYNNYAFQVARFSIRGFAIFVGSGGLLICSCSVKKKRISFKGFQILMMSLYAAFAVCSVCIWSLRPVYGALPYLEYTIILVCIFCSNLQFQYAVFEGFILCVMYNVAIGFTGFIEIEFILQWVMWNIYSVVLLLQLGLNCYGNQKSLRRDWFTRLQSIDREVQLLHVKQLEEISNAKSRFIANISHELRTPLHGIMGMAGCLRETPLNWDQTEYTDIIQRSAEALVSLTNDILDTSKIEQQGETTLSIQVEPFSFLNTVQDAFDILAKFAADKGLELAHQIPREIPKLIVSDPARVRQLILNFVNNAIKFTDKGTIQLSASVTQEDDNTSLRVTVKDTGRGIVENKIGELFKPFTQLGETVVSEGVGLGLYISKIIVTQLGGTIGVSSEVHKGSEFWFTIPLVSAADCSEPIFESVAGKTVAIAYRPSLTKECIKYYLTQRGHTIKEFDDRMELSNGDVLVMEYTEGCEKFVIKLRHRIPNLPTAFLYNLGTYVFSTEVGQSLHNPIKPEQLFKFVEDKRASVDTPENHPFMAGTESRVQGPGTPLRVLVAEDNAVNQKVVTNILSREGCEIVVAINGQQALEKAQKQRFNLILMDWQMPVLDGIEATKKIREFDAEVPVIFITAAVNKKGECLEAGANGVLTKPVRPAQLRELLVKYKKEETQSVPM